MQCNVENLANNTVFAVGPRRSMPFWSVHEFLSSQRTQTLPIVKINLWMLFGRKRVAFYCNDRTKNNLNGQNAGFRNAKECGVCSNNYRAIKVDTTEVYCGERWSVRGNPHSEKLTFTCYISCQSMGFLCVHLRFVCLVAIIRLKRLRNQPPLFPCSEGIFFHVVVCWLSEENMGREDCFLQCLYMP
jgi:hypothetical protein